MDTAKLAFYVAWDASGTGDARQLVMVYYMDDSTIELRNTHNTSLHLKRRAVPKSIVQSLFIGAQLVIFSRHLRILDAVNEQTAAYLRVSMEPAIGIWRASDVKAYSEALQALLDSGLVLTSCKLIALPTTLDDCIKSRAPQVAMEGDHSVMSASDIVFFALRGRNATRQYGKFTQVLVMQKPRPSCFSLLKKL